MSNRHQTHSSNLPPQPSTPDFDSSSSSPSSLTSTLYTCSCGIPDLSSNWIYCDSPSCPIKWYHWVCVSITHKPRGYWLCPSCRQEPPNIQSRRGATIMQMAKKAKRTVKDRTNAVSDENTVGQVAVKKSPTRPKKGIAVKKTPLKKTQSKWTGYVETDSEDEDENSEDTKLVQRASIVAKTNRTKIRTSKAQGRVTKSRAVHKTSTTATGVSRRVRSDVLKDVEESSRSMPKTLRRVGLRARTTARRLLKS